MKKLKLTQNIYFLLVAFLLTLFFPTKILANQEINKVDNVALFINQLRGSECCEPGNIKNVEQQINAFNEHNLSATFVLRYDVLNDREYTQLLRNLDNNKFELGAFLEITPQLAKDSGVEYTGDDSNWFQAQNVYTVGYSLEDRTKIIDIYMNKFYQVFGYFPKTTTAWVMDTVSLNYLHDKYGVSSHQITREQWGTDSYTMSGGPVHYPYFASKNWAFLPTQENNIQEIKNNLLILRQTGSDPLYNYGDTTNAFTTQPNDYAIDNKNINYFSALVNQFMSQTINDYNFVLLGLENSMPDKIQDEFINQINLIGTTKTIKTLTVNSFYNQYSNLISTSKITTLLGKDLIKDSKNEAFWINTKSYRIRLLKTSNEIKITDIRVYNEDLDDPYNTTVAEKHAYWIAPFIFDGSRFYTQDMIIPTDFKSKLRSKILPELQINNLEQKSSQKDFISSPDSLIFPIKKDSNVSYKKENNEIIVEYLNTNNEINTMKFGDNYFSTPAINSKNIFVNNSEFLKIDDNKIFFEDNYGLTMNCHETCYFSFSQPSNDEYKKLIENFYTLFFPELRPRGIDNNNSIYYAHNKYAVVDKNPIRFVFIPKDLINYSTLAVGLPKVTTNPKVLDTILHTPEGNGTTFFDVKATEIGKYMVTFAIDDFEQTHDVYVAPNCKIQKLYCVFHPNQAIWYLKSMLYTKLRNF